MTATVFVLHYENTATTDKCIDSILRSTGLAALPNIVVIDNGSPTPYYDVVRVRRLDENLHLIPAFNTVMQEYPSDIYICANNDTLWAPWTLSALLDVLENYEDVGIVAPGTNDRGAGILTVDRPDPALPAEITAHVDNCVWGWTQALVNAIGWPDSEGHTHRANWASNQDYCYRARTAGFDNIAVRGAYVEHAHDGGQDMAAWQAGHDWLALKYGAEADKVWA
jgi:GT2 family glycosyltransferase